MHFRKLIGIRIIKKKAPVCEKEDWEAMKKALITGVTGQDGAYLSRVLWEKGIVTAR
jgi:hypothetical protein